MNSALAVDRPSTQPHILVVEDDPVLNDQIAVLLGGNGYCFTQCFDGESALELAISSNYSLILLDIMLPGKDGLSVLNILRSCNSTPVIVVSAKHAEEERIMGLSAGADDYLAKPFNSQELLLRIDAVIRRSNRNENVTNASLQIDNLVLCLTTKQVLVGDADVSLTPTEFGLLSILVQNIQQVLSKAFLYQAVLNKQYSQYDRSLDMHMSRVRKKLMEKGWDGSRLQTVHGKGYCIK